MEVSPKTFGLSKSILQIDHRIAVIKTLQQVIQNGGFELNGGGDPGLDHWNKRGCQMSAEKWDVHQGVYFFVLLKRRSLPWCL